MKDIEPIPIETATAGSNAIAVVSCLMTAKRGKVKAPNNEQTKPQEPENPGSKNRRQTVLKRVASVIKSGQQFITYSGHFYDPIASSETSEMIGEAINEVAPQLQPANLIEHDFPVLDGGVREQMLDKAFSLLREAAIQRKPKEFKALANILHRAIQKEDGFMLDTDLLALIVEAQKGRVNIRRLAWKLVMGEDKNPWDVEPKELVSAAFQQKLKRIQSMEKNLRRYCERLGIPSAATGHPHADK